MLSSGAQRAYWTGRSLERAENTARILNVYTNLLLDLPKEAPISWHDMIRILGCSEAFEGHRQWPLETAAVRFMTSERTNPSSIAATIRQARENLRTLRDIVPKEAFEAVNELYLYGNDKLARATGRRARFGVLSRVIAYCQRSTGLFAGTMSHNQAYQFLKIGRNLERADMTTRIVDVAGELLRPDAVENEFDTTLWVNVLRTLSAYQAYRQSVRSRISPVRVLHFLLNDLQFPRAVSHCVAEVRGSVGALPVNEPVLKTIDEFEARMSALRLRDLARDTLHPGMDELQESLATIHAAIGATWFSPSVVSPPTARTAAPATH
jgi:uncharacterized alpha-E superfamily protein